MEKEQIVKLIDKNPSFALSCLISICKHKEQLKHSDRQLLSFIAKNFEMHGSITAMHLRLIRRKMKRYANQLSTLNIIQKKANLSSKTLSNEHKLITLSPCTKYLVIDFPKGDLDSLRLIKTSLKGRKFNKDHKTIEGKWIAPPTHNNIEILRDNEFILSDDVESIWNSYYPKPKKLPRLLQVKDYQQEGLEFLVGARGRGVIADEMGLGKTLQALYWIFYMKISPVLITMPKSVLLNWEDECYKWIPKASVQVIHSKKEHEITKNIVLLNYDSLYYTMEVPRKKKGEIKMVKTGVPFDYLLNTRFKACIVDELQNFRNKDSLRSQALRKIQKRIPYLIGLSGTPMKNRPIDFWNFLNMVDKNKWGNKFTFGSEFCNLKHNGFGLDYKGASNLDKLNKKLSGTMIRRLKSEVLDQLPPKTRTIVPLNIPIKELKAYRSFETVMMEHIKKTNNKNDKLNMIEKLKQKAMEVKLNACIEWIEDYITIFPKLLVLVHHKKIILKLNEHFKNRCISITGKDSITKRKKAEIAFKTNKNINILNGSITAVKEGLNFTTAKDSVTLELLWEPTDHQQAEDRVHRIGQESDNVGAYYLVLPDSIEMRIAKLLDKKIKIINKAVDGKEAKTEDLFFELMNII